MSTSKGRSPSHDRRRRFAFMCDCRLDDESEPEAARDEAWMELCGSIDGGEAEWCKKPSFGALE